MTAPALKTAMRISEALGLFPSVIKSGEHWSGRCEEVRQAAIAEHTALIAAARERDDLREQGAFILERLSEFENDGLTTDQEREWAGHVIPALARFRQALNAGEPT